MRTPHALVLAAVLAASSLACRDDSGVGPASAPADGRVFIDNFIGADFQAFSGSKVDAVQLDNTVKFRGTASLRVTIPAPGDPTGGYAGGAFVSAQPRDLSGYDALTFYARASVPATLNVAGFGNDNTGTSLYTVERNDIALTTSWQKYTIPIPLASRLTLERGLFFFAEGPEGTAGYELWLDDIRFETLGTITNPRPTLAAATVRTEVGATQQLGGLSVTFAVDGVDHTVRAFPSYFAFQSTNTSVATVNSRGLVTVLGPGDASITASLGGLPVAGALALSSAVAPTVAAPVPTRDAANVISLFSNTYTNVTVDTWSAVWDQADVTDVTIAGNATKRYANLVFAGVEFTSAPVDARTMTGFHFDAYVNDATDLRVKLVDFGANRAFGGGDDTEHEVRLNTTSSPAIVAGQWNSIDLPLSAFTGMTGKGAIAQMILSGSSPITYIDNVYFYRVPVPPAPPAAAPAPTAPAGSVISLFSNAYTNRPVDTWSASWDQADLEDLQIGGNDVKKYSNFTFAGVEFTSQTIDASAMTTFHLDYWTPEPTGAPADFKIKLVDFGADNAFGGGDDSEHELTFTAATIPALATGEWVRFSIPLAAFTGLTARAHLAQMIFVSGPNVVFLDNIYFSTTQSLTAPVNAAPTPTYAPADVISLFSNPYTNRTVDTWSAVWDAADVADVQVAGNDVKRYTNLTFAGIEFTSQTIDATAMTHFRMDIWTPDASAPPAAFKVKLVDFGPDGAFGGGDDTEHELTFESTSSPALATGAWVTLDIPLSQFTGLTRRANLAQMIIVGVDPLNTVFVDNVLLHR